MDAKKVTHEALAEVCGVSRPAVTHWTADRREPDFATLRKIAAYLGVPAEQLLLGDESGCGVPAASLADPRPSHPETA